MRANEERTLERIRYWQGQRLRSADFRAELSTEAQLLSWHNRALHGAFGVSLGLETSAVTAGGQLTAVKVEPGVAYDCFGRPLILLEARTVPLPDQDTAPSLTLVMRYRENAEFPQPGETAGVCFTCCVGAAGESPDFDWLPSESYTSRDGVALAAASTGQGARVFRRFVPMAVRPEAKPYLASGSTIPGATPWSFWMLSTERVLGLETKVDTSAAGFTRTPCYFATVQGLDPGFADVDFVPVVIPHVESATPTGFLFRLLLAKPEHNIILLALRARARRRLRNPAYVTWLGCQAAEGTDQCLAPAAAKPCCS